MGFLNEAVRQFFIFFAHYPVQMLIAECLFCFFTPKRKMFYLRLIPLSVLLCALPYFFPYYGKMWTVGGWFTFSFLFYFVASMAIIWFSFEITWQQTLFFGSSAYLMQHLVDDVYRGVTAFFSIDTSTGAPDYPRRIINFFALVAVYVILYFVFVKKVKENRNMKLDNRVILFFAVATVLIVYVLSMWIYFKGYNETHKIYDAICCMLLLLVLSGVFERSKIQEETDTVKRLLKTDKKNSEITKQNIELINLKCHDLKHQISSLKDLGGEALQKSIAEAEKAVSIYDSSVKTGNKTLDIILTDKRFLCDGKGITLSCIADGSAFDFMEETDMFSLFGNAIDNAIEAVEKIENPDMRVITLKVEKKAGVSSLHVDNYCAVVPEFEGGLPKTTKNDERFHGYGVKSMKYLTEKYGGTMSVFVKNGYFNLNIIFPES